MEKKSLQLQGKIGWPGHYYDISIISVFTSSLKEMKNTMKVAIAAVDDKECLTEVEVVMVAAAVEAAAATKTAAVEVVFVVVVVL